MGEVIEFRLADANGRSRRASNGHSGDCQILLFTGVRYERHSEVALDAVEAEAPVSRPTGTAKPRVGAKRRKKQA